MSYRVKLDIFEGPLDLLLHLVKKNEVEIADIPVATITDQYLAYLDLLQQLDLDVAGEYLVMAATLLHLKSRLLLPGDETSDEEEGEDPRADLVRQLLEYQRFKEAADLLNRRDLLERDVFVREPLRDETDAEADVIYDVSLGDLLDALQEVLKRAAPEVVHQVILEQVSLREQLCFVLDTLRERTEAVFSDLFPPGVTRLQILVTFLAILELVRTRMIRLRQEEPFGPIVMHLAVSADAPLPESLEQL
ncbi:MAG TPA: segregation/condensation protein A [Candidatus Binatia bacterium]|jgi:segregation and condensation protein A|nr:segregation/condensation protein A [Candidatus Binatia bacterium]